MLTLISPAATARVEITREEFYYFLEALPPRWMGRAALVNGLPPDQCEVGPRGTFGFGEGCDPTRLYYQREGRYYAVPAGAFVLLTQPMPLATLTAPVTA